MAASLLKKMADKCRNVSFRRFQSLQFPATFRNVPIPRFRPFFVFRREFRSEQGYWDVDKGGSEGVDAKIQGVSKPEASGGEGADGGTGPGQEVIEEIQILNGRVNRYYREGMYVEALDTAHRAHELIITHYGERHMFAASIVNNKALINKHLGKLEEAGRMYKISMELYHDAVGSEHPSYATATHNLALVERLRGSTDEAIRLFSLALDIRRKVHGPEHVDVAVSMHNLGSALRDKGDLDQALNLQENALVILRRRVSTEHLSTATCMNALGLTHKRLEDFEKALDMYTRALGVQRRELGARHSECLATMHNMAECYTNMGDELKANVIREEILRLVDQQT